jgi:hypothetical protein
MMEGARASNFLSLNTLFNYSFTLEKVTTYGIGTPSKQVFYCFQYAVTCNSSVSRELTN